jgi:hypothetical protein
MFAQSFLDFGLTEGLLFVIRIIATVGGAVVGWFVCDPLTRGIYRLSFKGTTPGSLLFLTKLGGATGVALLIWFFMPLGGGGGGLGWGSGTGGGPGKGAGQGGDKKGTGTDDKTKPGKETKDAKAITPPKAVPQRELLKIEILGGPRFKDDGEDRYYLFKGKETQPPRSLTEVEEYFKKNHDKLQVEIIHTEDTAVSNMGEGPTPRLRKLANQYGIPTQGPKD